MVAANAPEASVRTPSPRKAALARPAATSSFNAPSHGNTSSEVMAMSTPKTDDFGMRTFGEPADRLEADVPGHDHHCGGDPVLRPALKPLRAGRIAPSPA